uniref:Uncharacterized protein n=1 Tax=Arundo donax TaxID=35708 RepID=A0A0A9CGY4_ARUDO
MSIILKRPGWTIG